QGLGLETVATIGLDIDLEDLVEFVEQVDERGPQIALECLEYARRKDLQRFRLGAVDVQVELGAVGAEGRREALQVRVGIALLDELVRVPLELRQTKACAVFHYHLEAARLAQTSDRRRDDDKGQRFLDPCQLPIDGGDDPILGETLIPIFPALVYDERRRNIRHVGEIQDREAPDV